MPGTGLLLAILAVLSIATVAAEDCAVRYTHSGRKPLLFGGVLDRCIAGCAPRTSQWAQTCAFKRENDPKMVCTPSAANRSFALAETLGGGEAMQLSPCDLVRHLRGRTLWLIGDSHARFFYRALQCFLLDFWDQQECQATLDSEANAQLANMPAAPGGAYCFHLLGPASGRVCMVHVVLGTSLVENPQIAEGGVLPLLHKQFAQPQDIFYINFGIWHKNLDKYEGLYLPALEALARFHKATKARFPHVVFGETPAQHQRTGSGQQCAAATGFRYDVGSGLLLTTPAVNAALRSGGATGVASNAGAAGAKVGPVVTASSSASTTSVRPGVNAGAAAAGRRKERGAEITVDSTTDTSAAAAATVPVAAVARVPASLPSSVTARVTGVTAANAVVGARNVTAGTAGNITASTVPNATADAGSAGNATAGAAGNATAGEGGSAKASVSGNATVSAAGNGMARAGGNAATSVNTTSMNATASNATSSNATASNVTASNATTGPAGSSSAGAAANAAVGPASKPAGSVASNVVVGAAVNRTASAAVNRTASAAVRTMAGPVSKPAGSVAGAVRAVAAAGNATASPQGKANALAAGSATAASTSNATAAAAGNAAPSASNSIARPAASPAFSEAAGAAVSAAASGSATPAELAAEQAASSYQQAWDLGIVVNQLANEVLSRGGIPVLPFFNITVPLHDNHASIPLFSGKLDCMHYCHPGAPQMWVWYLYEFLRSPQGVQPLPNQANPNYTLPCRVMKSAQ